MQILNPDIDFWNSDRKTYFWANLGPKIQSCPFCLKIGARSISRMLIPNSELDFRPKKLKLSVLSENWYTWYLKDVDFYSNIIFVSFKS